MEYAYVQWNYDIYMLCCKSTLIWTKFYALNLCSEPCQWGLCVGFDPTNGGFALVFDPKNGGYTLIFDPINGGGALIIDLANRDYMLAL